MGIDDNWHEQQKERWANLGRKRGLITQKEYPTSNGRVDCVWFFEVNNEEIPIVTIECEGNNGDKQIQYNFLKTIELNPLIHIHHFKEAKTGDKFRNLWTKKFNNRRFIVTNEVEEIESDKSDTAFDITDKNFIGMIEGHSIGSFTVSLSSILRHTLSFRTEKAELAIKTEAGKEIITSDIACDLGGFGLRISPLLKDSAAEGYKLEEFIKEFSRRYGIDDEFKVILLPKEIT